MGPTGNGADFKGWLERGLGSAATPGTFSIADRMEQRVEAQVMGRVRSLDAGAEGPNGRGARGADESRSRSTAEARRERGAAEAERAERAAEQRPSERANERDDPSERTEGGALGAAQPAPPREAPRSRALEGRARSLDAADAAAANGAENVSSGGPTTASAAASAVGVASAPPSAPSGATNTASAALASSTAAPGGVTAVGAATSTAPANAPHGAGVGAPRAATDTQVAAPAEAAPHSAPAEDLELAEKVMRQLRARLQVGQREALIELRPSELGRIGVHLRLENGALTATIRAEHPETLAVLEAHAPELRAWLAQDGTDVREIDLGLAERGALFDKPQQRQHDTSHGRRSSGATATERRERAPEAVQAPKHTNTSNSAPGVDLLV